MYTDLPHKDPTYQFLLNSLVRFTIWLFPLSLSACQGFNERVPSSAMFEVQTKESYNADKILQNKPSKQSVSHQLNKAEQDQTSAQHAQFVLAVKSEQHSAHSPKDMKLHCEWAFSQTELGLALLQSLLLPITHSQSELWLEVGLTQKFKKALSSVSDHLPSYSPLDDQGGLWVVYSPHNRPQQSLLLAKPIPWMNERAKVLARCQTNKLLTELTFVPLSLDKSREPHHKLSLVSHEFQVHSTTD